MERIEERLESSLRGEARREIERFYSVLPSVPMEVRRELLIGLGHDFESYDVLFAYIAAYVQDSMEETSYSRRYKWMQSLLRPYCSEFGIEAGRPLMRTHRELFAEFYRLAVGEGHPESYPSTGGGRFIAISRCWVGKMRASLACEGKSREERAHFALGYNWAVERLSIDEFDIMRGAWKELGVECAFLEAHCEVEEGHALWAREALRELDERSMRAVLVAVRRHESELAGFYRESRVVLEGSAQGAAAEGLNK